MSHETNDPQLFKQIMENLFNEPYLLTIQKNVYIRPNYHENVSSTT